MDSVRNADPFVNEKKIGGYRYKHSAVIFQIPFDVSFHMFLRLENSEMPFTEDIRLKSKKLLHRLFPLADVGPENV